MMSTASHKTVFLLDNTAIFGSPCEQVELDVHKRGASSVPSSSSTSVTKTMWTCASESVLEYCRIVWDVFPVNKCIRFVAYDEVCVTNVSDTWEQTQSTSAVCRGLALIGRPKSSMSKSKAGQSVLLSAFKTALANLSELSSAQRVAMSASKMANRGRIVWITHLSSDFELRKVLETFSKELNTVNYRAKNDAHDAESEEHTVIRVIDEVCLDIVHCLPSFMMMDNQITATRQESIEFASNLKYKVHVVDAGRELAKKMLLMATKHFGLASTTVTGIPMKEEQNASSSANYDVELFHEAEADANSLYCTEAIHVTKEGCEYETVTLKWCTPRGSTADMHFCTLASRITPVDVNSRPSSCLTNFLLSGRSVMLEMPRRSGGKTLSHMLTSHSGEIFMHTLARTRHAALEDPPSISEINGGRVTDYRIPDLADIMKHNRLAVGVGPSALKEARARLGRFTLVCPMTINATTIFNMAALEGLQRLIMQEEELNEESFEDCKKAIGKLLAMETRGDALPIPPHLLLVAKGKTMKKEDQYKLMFNELEAFLTAHCRTERHVELLDHLLESRNKPVSGKRGTLQKRKNDEEEDDDSIIFVKKKEMRSKSNSLANGKRSLLDICMIRLQKEANSHHQPFAGQQSVGERVKLYMGIRDDEV